MNAITIILIVVLMVMGAYALVTDMHYSQRGPRQRLGIQILYFVVVAALVLRILGIWG